jgi:hypothetical protein
MWGNGKDMLVDSEIAIAYSVKGVARVAGAW